MTSSLPSFPEYIKALNSSADVEIDLSKPLKLYLRSTELVFKQANFELAAIYFGEGDLEKSYILFMKFSNLVLDKLPKHSEYGRLEFSAQKSKLKEMCRTSVSKLENIRPRLEQAYKDTLEAEKLQLEEAKRVKLEQLALKEDTERLQKLKSQQSVGISKINSTPELSSLNSTSEYSVAPMLSSVSNYSLPSASVPTCNTIPVPFHFDDGTNGTLKAMQERLGITSISQIQSKNSAVADISPAPSKPKYFSENGEALRPVHVPECLINNFLQLAAQNTSNNLETCGVLAGKLNHNEFIITCLIIPKQVATSDTCAMINEEEIITAQDSLDVMSLGWIHTHPTQRCFLSSVDLHTHMPFQLLMAEAIAIVCAPTQTPNFGIFRLTDPPGLEIITNCQHPSAFHPHPGNALIYRELKGPDSHAQLDPNLTLEVIDLRK